MNPHAQSFRKLNAAVVYTKVRKFVESRSDDFQSLMKRINVFDRSDIDCLVALVPNREEFLVAIEAINQRLQERRKTHNASWIEASLESEVYLQPLVCRDTVSVDWLNIPKYLVPDHMSMGTYLAGKRKDWRGLANRVKHCRRKRCQIEIILSLLNEPTKQRNLKILDICGGRGDLSVMIAWMNPESSITLVDRNKCALQQAQYRATQLGLTNLKTFALDLFNLDNKHEIIQSKYDIVIGLHACGSLTDVILEKFAPNARMTYIATCCFGKMDAKHRSRYSKVADADVGGNSHVSRLAKLVINSKRLENVPAGAKKILEVDERYFGQKNQILQIVR